jgi:ubiquinone/menaquinone biosynthesis C-methylase UbiE
MLTTDKIITTSDYWDKIYSGNNNNAKVDASNTKRVSTFDRFNIVVAHAEGPSILGVGSGHAHIEKRIKALHKDWHVVASDQSEEAMKVANYEPYIITSAYHLPCAEKEFDTIIATQMLEYLEFPDKFLTEAKRAAKNFLCTVPKGEMKSWSQLRIYDSNNLIEFLSQYGNIETFEVHESLLLAKIKFV